MGDIKNFIAARVAKELKDGDVVNLGIGLPTLVPNHLPEGVDLTLQSENGFVGLVPLEEGKESPHVVNAGGVMAGIADDGAFFSSADSFAIIRGGHVDVTVLGSLQVDEKGNIEKHVEKVVNSAIRKDYSLERFLYDFLQRLPVRWLFYKIYRQRHRKICSR